MRIDDGKTKTDVAMEWVTSIVVPIIPDVDAYKPRRGERMFTLQMPEGEFGKACQLAFSEDNGKKIEAWMDKNVVLDRGDKLIIELEDKGYVRLVIRRGGH